MKGSPLNISPLMATRSPLNPEATRPGTADPTTGETKDSFREALGGVSRSGSRERHSDNTADARAAGSRLGRTAQVEEAGAEPKAHRSGHGLLADPDASQLSTLGRDSGNDGQQSVREAALDMADESRDRSRLGYSLAGRGEDEESEGASGSRNEQNAESGAEFSLELPRNNTEDLNSERDNPDGVGDVEVRPTSVPQQSSVSTPDPDALRDDGGAVRSAHRTFQDGEGEPESLTATRLTEAENGLKAEDSPAQAAVVPSQGVEVPRGGSVRPELSAAEVSIPQGLQGREAETVLRSGPDVTREGSQATMLDLTGSRLSLAVGGRNAAAAVLAPELSSGDNGASRLSAAMESLSRQPEPLAPALRTFVPQPGIPVAVGSQDWGNALGNRILWLANQQLSVAQLRLDPPDLGPLQVRVSVQNEQVSITFISHQATVREALDQSALRLREMFADQGLDLVNVDISDQSLARESQGNKEENSSGHGAAADTDDEEVTVAGPVTAGLIDHYA